MRKIPFYLMIVGVTLLVSGAKLIQHRTTKTALIASGIVAVIVAIVSGAWHLQVLFDKGEFKPVGSRRDRYLQRSPKWLIGALIATVLFAVVYIIINSFAE